MLGAKGGANQALERLPSFSPCREFQFAPRAWSCSACLCPASGPLGKGIVEIGSNCSSFKDGFSAIIPPVNHRSHKEVPTEYSLGAFTVVLLALYVQRAGNTQILPSKR